MRERLHLVSNLKGDSAMISQELTTKVYAYLKDNPTWQTRYAIADAIGSSEHDVHAGLHVLVLTCMVHEDWQSGRATYRCAYLPTTIGG